MGAPLYLSLLAVAISLVSVAWSIHIGRRDRGRLKATSELYYSGPDSDDIPSHLEIRAVNHGRRPVILTMLRTELSDGTSYGTYLNDRATRLGENEAFLKTIEYGDYVDVLIEGKIPTDLWFEDTLGRRYKVKGAKEHLKKLWGEGKENGTSARISVET